MTAPVQDSAIALPTKRFFVSMLTRDIDLKDAILDLVDNCLDGALRSAGVNPVDYAKHSIEIEVGRARFRISDDCGGIPREIAKNYAFKMGRERADERDSESETIGMYGIGMKRAIFKMGTNAVVRSFNSHDRFKVICKHMQAHLGAHARDRLGQEVRGTHPVPDRSERVLHRLPALSHSLGLAIESSLHRVDDVLVLPPPNTSVREVRALRLDRALLAV